jgi:hypothetical protein
MIESASQILNDISNQRRKIERYLRQSANVESALLGLKVVLMENFVWAPRTLKAGDLDLKFEDVLIGPIDFD